MKTLSYRGSPVPSIQDGMPVALLASALHLLDEQGKTMDDANGLLFFHWDPSAGPGVLSIESAEQEKSTVSMPLDGKGKSLPVLVSLPCVLRLAPEKFPGLTINVSASGSYATSQGQDAPKAEVLPVCDDLDPMRTAARAWLRDQGQGASAYALCVGITGETDFTRRAPTGMSVPLDGADFGRCMAFFRAVPQAREHMGKMAAMGPKWAALVERWDELEALHADQKTGELYDAITLILANAMRAPRPR